MSGSEDSTRPISVAELLARNGTIGAPPVGGHRRRRRRNSETVSVAELTGEIPVVRDEAPAAEVAEVEVAEAPEVVETDLPVAEAEADADAVAEAGSAEAEEPQTAETVVEYPDVTESAEAVIHEATEDEVLDQATEDEVLDQATEDEVLDEVATEVEVVDEVATEVEVVDEVADEVVVDAVADEAVLEEVVEQVEVAPAAERVETPPPLSRAPVPSRRRGLQRSYDPRPARRVSGAEQMAFDPVDQSVDLAELVDEHTGDTEEIRSYLRSPGGPLFSGESVVDDLARRGVEAEAADVSEAGAVPPARPRGVLSLLGLGVIAVLQSLLAVMFGAGLFIAFDQLWRWNNIVALALSVLVILSLVVAVRVVRRTEDIASTLIAVAVGALVTLGPLALLQST
ncbi:MAG: hypothetical protein O2892_16375 [Actinomycetota bacterium]|nr:hypothetical protein [Actinomycetota bacterium]MDA2950591.1 hypothetical protein [Actinomycetota bacterium]